MVSEKIFSPQQQQQTNKNNFEIVIYRGKATSPQLIECVHDGHVGGPKQYNDFPLGNIFYFYANIFYCFSPPTWPPCTHSIVIYIKNL